MERLNHWLDELPYHKQMALSRKARLRDKTASLLGLQLLKLGMQGLGFSAFSLADLNFCRNGKPAGSNGAEFSISHAGGLIACVIGLGSRVGIDVEAIAAWDSPGNLTRYLDAWELAAARHEPHAGLRIWAGKEAIVKAAGNAGLGELAAVKVRGRRGWLHQQTWYLHEARLLPGFMVQVATETPHSNISILPARLP